MWSSRTTSSGTSSTSNPLHPTGFSLLILALDSATPFLSLVLFETDGGAVVAEAKRGPPESHSHMLPLAVQSLLTEAGTSLEKVGGVAVGIGPGSFTGLRVGLATAKGLCYSRRIPLAGVSSLKAMAAEASEKTQPGTLLVPCLHARKNEVYAGFYRSGSLEAAEPEIATHPQALATQLEAIPGRLVLFGNGRVENAELFKGRAEPVPGMPLTPGAAAIARLSGAWGAYDSAKVFGLEPHYIRASEAEVKFPQGLRGPGPASRRVQPSRRRSSGRA